MMLMNRIGPAICFVFFLFVVTSAPASSAGETTVSIVVSPDATSVEQLAARELADTLTKLYSKAEFEVTESTQRDGPTVFLGTLASSPRLCTYLGDRTPREPEGYVVTTVKIDGYDCGLVIGADPAGVMYGVHGLLRHLGVGYFLNSDALPEPTTETFSFAGWNLSDRPLVPTRMVFNWHNFLSGCSTWDVEQWRGWITQSQKMGYNAVMVHAYGNNPMAGFEFEGNQKPVGYLSSTRVGRDWSTNHVNDVRRLFGGDVFDTPVFGCVAAVNGTDRERTRAAQSLMAEAFATAEARGVDVYFAVDVDTTSANPQQLIKRLPEHARFEIDVKETAWMGQAAGKMQLVNPETPEGYAFYRAQVRQLLDVYPQIDCFVVWHRKDSTPWMEFAVESMPETWQEEFAREVAKTPDAEGLYHSRHLFAQAKIVAAFQRAVKELGRDDVKIAFGSWDFHFLPAAHRFMPSDVALIPLDWMVLRDDSVFDTRERRLAVAEVAATRPVIPIAWAHHDDGNYVGRPYTPIPDFHDRLTEMKCQAAGFGIIHWTTKPLDLYFQSLVNQTWQSSENEPLETTCRRMARQLIGDEQAERFAAYLEAWVTTMPKIGRETGDFFIDHELKDLPGAEVAQHRRLKLLDAIDRSRLNATGNAWLDYFAGLEQYILDIYRTENVFHRAKKQYLAGQIDAARTTMETCRPEEVIRRFADFSQNGGLTRGEEGLIVTMNTRWLPHYVRIRQMLATDSVRYNFAATSHDPLAQSRGVFTFHFDSQGGVWQCLGAEETDAQEFTIGVVRTQGNAPEADAIAQEICRAGIESDKPITLTLQPILPRGGRKGLGPENLAAGNYRLTLLTIEPDEAAVGDNVFDLRAEVAGQSQTNYDFDILCSTDGETWETVSYEIASPPRGLLALDRIDVLEATGGTNRVLALSYPVMLDTPSTIRLTLTPAKGKARICGMTLTPVEGFDACSREAIKEIAERVNRSQLKRPWKEEDRNWIRATYYTGVMAMYRATGDNDWLTQAQRWAEKHDWQVGNEKSGANVLTCVQTYLQLCEQQERVKPIRQTIEWLESGRPNTPSGADLWYLEADRRYADSLYVGPPALAMLAQATGDPKYLRIMDAMFWDVHRELFDEDAGLFYRDGRFRAKLGDVPVTAEELLGKRETWVHTITPGGKKVLWSRGNGWVFAGIARILAYLPEDHQTRPKYAALFQHMAESLTARQQPDGAWRMNLDDPDQYPISEASGTGFFTYGLAWGINHGFLDREEYEGVALRGWNRLAEMVSLEGKVQWGQPVSGSPYDIRREDSHEYVTGTFLLAASEMWKLVATSDHAGGDNRP